VRLTRRGQLVLLALLVVLTGLVGVLVAASTGEAAAPAGPAPAVVVQPGDTLWSIAARYAPGPDPFGTIERIRQLNGLDGYTVHAGQKLVLPPRRG
jgi:LysM repeat protein